MGIFEAKEMLETLAESIRHMPERERLVLALLLRGLTLAEIGQVLGVTESRVQIHTKAVLQLVRLAAGGQNQRRRRR